MSLLLVEKEKKRNQAEKEAAVLSTEWVVPFFSLDSFNENTPIIHFVNKILLDAIEQGASDIHFEPYEENYRIRLRKDGILATLTTLPIHLASKFTARLKVLSDLDIAEQRLPQDGRFKIDFPSFSVDLRISTCPTLFGEKIVVRILDPTRVKLDIDMLGLEEDQKIALLQAIHRPQGLILATGPTGSGKTTSLYTALNLLNKGDLNISTVEDPIEIRLPGLNQVNIHPKIGLTFSRILSAFLRQDPDVIMVGEIRDTETAEIAIRAAQTGHLVLSTLHTNSAPETLTRLIDMRVPAFHLATAVTLVIAQRLVRRLCEHCKVAYVLPPDALLQIGFRKEEIASLTLFRATHCHQCHGGFKGRIGLYEVMPLSDAMRQQIIAGATLFQLREQMKKESLLSLWRAGLNKVKQGLTSLEELNRVC